VDAGELLPRAEAAGVTFVKGADFFPAGAGGERSARLAFSYASPSEIDEGISLLATLV
jgi:2-aminoadipate transaminase